ncbi:MAG: iron-sulfur-binding reductase [Desulfuromonas sp.]|uniref:heterodisulfide reductase-related iron-sulfur binding cluster n=1 Tax=Desulfuromonas sp. TaxID=892 RepID=UPI000CB2B949|nr:(Fe-S)-binding protein [Desulfuromonas sp.]PLX82011.1 MAG: iron-sulfur-binding reductase [Desulfuromonas sp.]
MMEVTRPLGTYSHTYWLMYLLTAAAAAVLAWGVGVRISRWRTGRGAGRDRMSHPWRRSLDLAADVATQRRLRSPSHPWLFHGLIVWGFGIFLLGTFCLMLQEHFGLPTFSGGWYLILNLGLDLFSVLVLVGVILAAWRRWVLRPEELSRARTSGLVLALVAALPVSGLLLEGVRLAREPDPWAPWSPVGYSVAGLLPGVETETFSALHLGLWWGHLLVALGFLAAIPFTRLFHLVAGPAALFFADRDAARALVPLDLSDEDATSFGVGRIEDFYWKRLLDADACTGCGRCQSQCPAWQSGKSLSPKEISESIQSRLIPGVREARQGRSPGGGEDAPALAGEVVQEKALWACTTCRSCEAHCPVGVEHVPRIIDMRRFLVLTKARFPSELLTAFRGLEHNGNPFGLESRERVDRAVEAQLPIWADTPEAEILLWPGCNGVYDPRYRQVIEALAELLKRAGIRFAVPGEEAVCCGDAARRLGNEYLCQELVVRNLEAFERMGIRRIVTACPHCFNTLRHEYPAFGDGLEVVHHSELLSELLSSGRLRLPSGGKESAIGFHDPCYLARYNGITTEPRQLLRAAGIHIEESDRKGKDAFCCGGGGGRIWLEEQEGRPMGDERVGQLMAAGALKIATACPFCLTMLTQGNAKLADGMPIQVQDVAEILAEKTI